MSKEGTETVQEEKGKFASYIEKAKSNLYLYLLKKVLFSPLGRSVLLKRFDKELYQQLVVENTDALKTVREKKYYFLMSMLTCAKRNIDKGWISKEVAEKIANTLVKFNFVKEGVNKDIPEKFKAKYGILPPSFIVFAPTQRCNLRCCGCYASATEKAPSLPFEIIEKVFAEVHDEWGNHFMTITGGEPLMYNDNGRTLFDLWKKYDDMFFLFYTNGTLITKDVAKKLAELGNVTPAISIEGWEKETDERRGKGVYKKILEAAANLKEAGVPFGASITATAKNAEVLLDDKFYDYIFLELGAAYMWMFQLMPIGQAKDMKEWMLSPDQRIKLFRKWEYLLKEKRYCIADFWNSGVLANGCIAYGRSGGYLYIDWNGNITPCTFVPFYEDNLYDLYKNNKKVANALLSDLFVNGRKWQEEYGLSCPKSPDNWLMPCSIRDHFKNFKENILSKNAKPEDKQIEAAMKSKDYHKVLEDFDAELEKKTKPIWEKEYLEKGKKEKNKSEEEN